MLHNRLKHILCRLHIGALHAARRGQVHGSGHQRDLGAGFAAESQDLLANAQAKRLRKGVPLLVGNIGPATFGKDDNALLLVDAERATELGPAPKLTLARQLVAEIGVRLATLAIGR